MFARKDACAQMRQLAVSICPVDWVEKWDDEREIGNFAGIKMNDTEKTH